MAKEASKETETQGKSSKGMLFWVMVIALVSVGTSIAATLYLTGVLGSASVQEEHVKATAPSPEVVHRAEPIYIPLDPPFVVNFEAQGVLRFLQVSMVVMTYDPDIEKAVKMHMPRIRNDIIILLTSQDFETLSTPEGKQKMREEILEKIRRILKQTVGRQGIEDVYFTSFVMQ